MLADAIRAFADASPPAEILLALIFGCVLRIGFLIVNRTTRTIRVALRGWPPAHLDADGDWRPIESDKT